ncbi:hypothetical protein AVEN_24720-1, partial [Araneus ventricosus]
PGASPPLTAAPLRTTRPLSQGRFHKGRRRQTSRLPRYDETRRRSGKAGRHLGAGDSRKAMEELADGPRILLNSDLEP